MTIPVRCPHCETEYQLNPDLVGKSMRCPNPECREVFEVRAYAPPPRPEPPAPAPVVAESPAPAGPAAKPVPPAAGKVSDLVPFLEVEPSLVDLPYSHIEINGVGPVEFLDDPPAMRIVPPAAGAVPPAALGSADLSIYDSMYGGRTGSAPADLSIYDSMSRADGLSPARRTGDAESVYDAEVVVPSPAPADGESVYDAEVVPDGLPVVPARPVAKKAAPLPPAVPRPKPPTAPLQSTGPKEVVWAGEAAPTLGAPVRAAKRPPVVAAGVPLDAGADDEAPLIRRRRRRRSWAKPVLFGVLGLIVLTVGGGGVAYFVHFQKSEERDAAQAAEAYGAGNYAVAQKRYEDLQAAYPGSSDLDKYQFFAALSETRAAVGSVTARENPAPGAQRFDRFVADFGESPLARPGAGFGADVVQTGQRLADTFADHGDDRLKAYKAGLQQRKTNEGELATADADVAEGGRLIGVANKFRDKDGVSLDPQRKRFDELTKAVAAERHRLAVLAPFRTIAQNPTAETIEQFTIALRDNHLAADPEGTALLADAERRLRELIGPARVLAKAKALPADRFPPVLFAAAVSGGPEPVANPEAAPDVVFAGARGVLYALDAATGTLLWGDRVAAPTADPRGVDLPVRVSVGGADCVLVVGEWGGGPGLAARAARTGEPLWYQPLRAPAAARPLVVGGRAYLPLRDALGTVAEFDVLSGDRTADLTVRQPVGGGLAALPGDVPGLFYLIVPGDAKRTFVFEVGREDAAGRQLEPRCVRVFQTDHPRDSLRSEPLLVAAADPAGPRYLILSQLDGAAGMKLRAFPLPTAQELALAPSADPPTPKPAEVTVPGWAWFPPTTDGERVVLATDAGAFLAFGVNQIGNADRPLFTLPAPKPSAAADGVARSQVVAVEEDAYWAVLNGLLVRLRTAVDPAGGLRITVQGDGRAVGEPVQRPQLRPDLGLGVVVARTGAAANAQAVAFDLQTGLLRWQRRLGVTPAGPPVARPGGGWVVADEDGGVYGVPAPAPDAPPAAAVAAVVAPPYDAPLGKAAVTATPDGRAVWVTIPEADRAGRRLRIRLVVDGVLKEDAVVPLPDQIAGAPVAVGPALLVPATNGYVYRYLPGDKQLAVGPLWRGDAGAGEAVCHVGPDGADEFLATDGNRALLRWRWRAEAGAKPEKVGGPWEMRAKVAAPPVAVRAGDAVRVLAADVAGAVFLFDADKPGGPVRRWHGGDDSPIPAGPPTDRVSLVPVGGRTLAVYSVDRRHLVALDPDAADPAWVARDLAGADGGELAGWAVAGDRVVVTDQTGRRTLLDAATGKKVSDTALPPQLSVVTTPVVPGPGGRGFVGLADGSGLVVDLGPPAR